MSDTQNNTDPSFTVINHWMLVADYANACGVVNRTIIERIERGMLSFTKIDGLYIIDAQASPCKLKVNPSEPKAVPLVWPPNMPAKKELVWVWRFANEHNVRADALYKAVLFGKISGWGVSNRVLVRKSDALQIIQGK